jgi:hypothetical protein
MRIEKVGGQAGTVFARRNSATADFGASPRVILDHVEQIGRCHFAQVRVKKLTADRGRRHGRGRLQWKPCSLALSECGDSSPLSWAPEIRYDRWGKSDWMGQNESDDKSSHSKVACPGAHLECGDSSPLCLGRCERPGGDLSPSGLTGQMKASVASLRGVAECCRQILLSKELIDRLAIHGARPVR